MAGRNTQLTLDEQIAIVRPNLRQAALATIAFIGRNQFVIENLALERFKTIGHEGYGDSSFHLSNSQLWTMTAEECADAFIYRAIRIDRDPKHTR